MLTGESLWNPNKSPGPVKPVRRALSLNKKANDMESKTTIEQEVTFLLNSPRERNTEQGKLVCKKALEALTSIQSKTELYDLLRKINHAFLGIEAHGLLTPQEFEAVKRLRKIESDLRKDGHS